MQINWYTGCLQGLEIIVGGRSGLYGMVFFVTPTGLGMLSVKT